MWRPLSQQHKLLGSVSSAECERRIIKVMRSISHHQLAETGPTFSVSHCASYHSQLKWKPFICILKCFWSINEIVSPIGRRQSHSARQHTEFLLKQNCRAWNSNLPSGVESLMFINGSWKPLPESKQTVGVEPHFEELQLLGGTLTFQATVNLYLAPLQTNISPGVLWEDQWVDV